MRYSDDSFPISSRRNFTSLTPCLSESVAPPIGPAAVQAVGVNSEEPGRFGGLVEMHESNGSVAIAETIVEDKHQGKWLIDLL
jgi:hypothetical protein